jgi:hypothetical protein
VDGTYPIWSLLRLVNVSGAITSTVNSLASASQSFVSAMHPDFVSFNNSTYGTIPNLLWSVRTSRLPASTRRVLPRRCRIPSTRLCRCSPKLVAT